MEQYQQYQYDLFFQNPTSLIELFTNEKFLDVPQNTEFKNKTKQNKTAFVKVFKKETKKQLSEIKKKELMKNESLSYAQGSKIKTKTWVNRSDEDNADLRIEYNEWIETLEKTQARLKELKSPNNWIRKIKGNPYK